MKIIFDRQYLSELLLNVSKSVSSKTTIPSLEGILIKAYNNKVNFYGYNLELLISTFTEDCEILNEGEIVINARILTDMVKKINSEKISISVNKDNNCTIKGDITEFNIIGFNSSDYPEMPLFDGEIVTEINGSTLKNMIEETIFSVSTNEQKPIHTGILFDISNKKIQLVAVDGFRLALRKENITSDANINFVVPSKTLSEISRLIKEDEEKIYILKNDKNIIFKIYNYTVISRLLEGDFLDYKSIIESQNKTTVTCDRRELFEMIDRTSLIINDRIKSPVISNFIDNKIKTSCETSIGNIYDEIDCEIVGDNIKIGYNNKYLIDALRVCKDEKINILFNGSLSPIKITPINDDSYLFLILPVRLKDE